MNDDRSTTSGGIEELREAQATACAVNVRVQINVTQLSLSFQI